MDDYTREMMDLKTLVTRTLEKKGVLAKIRAELRASVFEAIEEEDRVVESEEGSLPPALLGSCNDRAKQLHASPYRKDDYNWKYDGVELLEDVDRASVALETLQLDRKTRNLSSSWRHDGDGIAEDGVEHM